MKSLILLSLFVMVPLAMADDPSVTAGISVYQNTCPKNALFNDSACSTANLFQGTVNVPLSLPAGTNPEVVWKTWTGTWQKQVSFAQSSLKIIAQFSGQTLDSTNTLTTIQVSAQLYINGSIYPIAQVRSAGSTDLLLTGPAQVVGDTVVYPVLEIGPPNPHPAVSGGN